MKRYITALGLASLITCVGLEAQAVRMRGTLTFNSDNGLGTALGTFTYDTDSLILSEADQPDRFVGTFFEITSLAITLPTGETFGLGDYNELASVPSVFDSLGLGISFDTPGNAGVGIFATPLISPSGDPALTSAVFDNGEDLFLELTFPSSGSQFPTPNYRLGNDPIYRADLSPVVFSTPPFDLADSGTYSITAVQPVPEPFTILGSLTAMGIGAVLTRKTAQR